MPTPNPEALKPYLRAGLDLIPLFDHQATEEVRGKIRLKGKRPLHNSWPRNPYKPERQVQHMEQGSNVGIRLKAGDLVIDVDPRRFPEEAGPTPLARLCEDMGIDIDACPTVRTGSGGLHLYLSMPENIAIRDSMPDYPGIEFKSVGRQVVAAGSVHPETKNLYVWDEFAPGLEETLRAPKKLLQFIQRPKRPPTAAGGEYTQEELVKMLDHLVPEDYRDHNEWFTLMQACHSATAGDGRMEFINWSTQDPNYKDDGDTIGQRWDSLHNDHENSALITYRTLHKYLVSAGHGEVIPTSKAAEDELLKEIVDTDSLPKEHHERKGPLEVLNDKYWAVMDNGRFTIMWEEKDPETAIYGIDPITDMTVEQVPARSRWLRSHVRDFQYLFDNRKIEDGEGKATPLADAWLKWGNRRTARGVIFDPEREHPGYLNLWTGWGILPKRTGKWTILDQLLGEVLCDGNSEVYDYVLKWSANMVQRPGTAAEVAICFQGGKGVGKSTWGRALAALAGKHGLCVTSSAQLTGRFNSHMRDLIFLFADEALKPYDKDGESRLKGLITEPFIAYEAKGQNVASGRNMLHILMASNEDWFVPTGFEHERRFMVQKVNSKWQGDFDKFARLNEQLRQGGLEAFMWDLMNMNLSGWNPRSDIPETEAITEQKLMGMDPVQQWWFNCLMEGTPPSEPTRDHMNWLEGPIRVFKTEFREGYSRHCTKFGIPRASGSMGRANDRLFTMQIQKMLPNIKTRLREPVPAVSAFDSNHSVDAGSDGRAWAYELPHLQECRAAFETALGSEIEWTIIPTKIAK